MKATIEGVVRIPSGFSMTLAWPPSITATQELVVPRSMPITLAISPFSLVRSDAAVHALHPLGSSLGARAAGRPDLAQISQGVGVEQKLTPIRAPMRLGVILGAVFAPPARCVPGRDRHLRIEAAGESS